MMHYPKRGEKAYEFSVYNQEVRSLVKVNRHHVQFGDEWADAHQHRVCAGCEREAMERIGRKFPKSEGFVIAELREAVA